MKIRKRRRSSDSISGALIRCVSAGMIIGALFLTALLLGLAALLCAVKTLPIEYLPAMISVSCALAGFLAGFFSAQIRKRSGLITGALSALLLAILFCAVRFGFGEPVIDLNLFLRLFIMALCGGIGGIVAVNRKTDDRRKLYRKN